MVLFEALLRGKKVFSFEQLKGVGIKKTGRKAEFFL
jgi:hypothetical protein